MLVLGKGRFVDHGDSPGIGGRAAVFTLVLLANAPIVELLANALTGSGDVLDDSRSRTLLARSLGVSLGASGLALVIGTTVALILARVPTRGLPGFLLPLFAAFCIPPYFQALGWIGGSLDSPVATALLGHPAAVAVILGLSLVPLVALFVYVTARELPRSPEQAGLISAPPLRVVRRILLRPLTVPLSIAALVAFNLTFADYAVASLLQVPTYPIEVFLLYAGTFEPRNAARAAVPLLAIGGAVSLALALGVSRLVAPADSCSGACPWGLSRILRRVMLTVPTLVLIAILAPPLAGLLLDPPPLREASRAFEGGAGPLFNSLFTASLAALTAVALAWPASAALAARSRGTLIPLTALLLLPLSAPGSAYGIGWVELVNRTELPPLPGALAPAFCLAGRFAGLAALALAAARLRLPNGPVSAAHLQAGSRVRRSLWVTGPLLLPFAVGSGAVVAALSLHAVDIHVLTAAPGFELLSIRVDNLLHYGLSAEAKALALGAAALATLPLAMLLLAAQWVRALQHSP